MIIILKKANEMIAINDIKIRIKYMINRYRLIDTYNIMNYTKNVVIQTISYSGQMRKHKRESGIIRSGPATVKGVYTKKVTGKPGRRYK